MPNVSLKLDIFEAVLLLRCKPDLWYETAARVMQDHITPWRIFTSLNAETEWNTAQTYHQKLRSHSRIPKRTDEEKKKKRRQIQPLNHVGA